MSNDLKNVKHKFIAIVHKIKNKGNKRSSSKFTNSIHNTISIKLSNALRKVL